MPPSLLSDAALVTSGRPAPVRADLRTDAMLLTRGREGSESLIATALLIDAVRSGHLDVLEGRRVVAGRHTAGEPPLLADLRARVLAATPASPPTWIERTATFAPHRIATELVAAGLAMPLSQRFQRQFSLSVDAHAEVAARARISRDPALAVLLYTCGFPTGDPLPPCTHTLPPAERAILAALRETVGTATTAARLAG
jgi:hypothetical protein